MIYVFFFFYHHFFSFFFSSKVNKIKCIISLLNNSQIKRNGILWSATNHALISCQKRFIPLTLEVVVRAPQMTSQQYLSILPRLPLPSGNLQTPFPSISWCYFPISSSVFLSFLLLSLSLAELSSQCQRILRCGHTIWVSISLLWLGDHHALQLLFGLCWEPPRSSHGLCKKFSEVSYSITSQGLGSFSPFLLSRSSSHRHKEILLMLQVFLAEDPEIKYLFCGAPFGSETCLLFCKSSSQF